MHSPWFQSSGRTVENYLHYSFPNIVSIEFSVKTLETLA